jgi:hypothetical protein
MPPPPAPRFRVTLAPMPSDVPALIRLKRALKCLSRSFRLRCERVEELPEPPLPDHPRRAA